MKKSIGQFIAALRKANGMTQQDIADRLNVSNKAVSRWERDECAPDISLIPSLAELLGVSCDELLRGERILEAPISEKKNRRIEKQITGLVNRTLSAFKTLNYIAIALAAVGLVCMLGITAGFYRPTLGFFVALLFEIAAITIAAVALGRAKDAKKDNDLLTNERAIHFDKTLGNFSFHSFYAALAATALSLRIFATASDPYWAYTYLFEFPFTTITLALLYLKGKPLYLGEKHIHPSMPNLVQIGTILVAGILFAVSPYFNAPFFDQNIPRIFNLPIGCFLLNALAFLLMGINIVYFIIFVVKPKRNILIGVRNLFLLPATLIVTNMHQVRWENTGFNSSYTRVDIWYEQDFWQALAYCFIVLLIFSLIETYLAKQNIVKIC